MYAKMGKKRTGKKNKEKKELFPVDIVHCRMTAKISKEEFL